MKELKDYTVIELIKILEELPPNTPIQFSITSWGSDGVFVGTDVNVQYMDGECFIESYIQ